MPSPPAALSHGRREITQPPRIFTERVCPGIANGQVNKRAKTDPPTKMTLQPSPDKMWSSAQDYLRSMLSSDTYNLWFSPLRACGCDGNTLLLEVSNDFCEVWLKDNYMGLLEDAVGTVSGKRMQIRFKVASTTGALTQQRALSAVSAPTQTPAQS